MSNGKKQMRAQSISGGQSVTEMIRKRANEIYLKRGARPGNDWADWFEAERQIKSEQRGV